MTAIIKLGPNEATITDYKWSSANKPLAEMLNARLDPAGPSGADPNPDYTAALEVAEVFGGEVLHYEKMDFDAGRVY